MLTIAQFKCQTCNGAGEVQVQVPTTSLRSAEPTMSSAVCRDCHGKQVGLRASFADVTQYVADPLAVDDDLFELARAVARQSTMATPTEVVETTRPVAYGFRGKKTRHEKTLVDQPQDYWPLLTKTSLHLEDTTGSGWYRRDKTETEYRFCLAKDGSFRLMTRRQESTSMDGRNHEGGWSRWELGTIKDLDSFLVEFDFTGSYTRQSPGWTDENGWRETYETVASLLTSYRETDFEYPNVLDVRRLYPKGAGLYVALNKLLR